MAKNEKLGVFDCTMIVVSLVIGMGIFRTPVNVASMFPIVFYFFSPGLPVDWLPSVVRLPMLKSVRDFRLPEDIIKYFLTGIILRLHLQSTASS